MTAETESRFREVEQFAEDFANVSMESVPERPDSKPLWNLPIHSPFYPNTFSLL